MRRLARVGATEVGVDAVAAAFFAPTGLARTSSLFLSVTERSEPLYTCAWSLVTASEAWDGVLKRTCAAVGSSSPLALLTGQVRISAPAHFLIFFHRVFESMPLGSPEMRTVRTASGSWGVRATGSRGRLLISFFSVVGPSSFRFYILCES